MSEIDNSSQKKKEVPFVELFKRAAQIIWQNRFLLWFGVLIALGSPGSFNYSGNENGLAEKSGTAKNFLESHWQLVLAIAIVFFVIGIILFLISLAGKAGLIKSVSVIIQNKKTSFGEGWKKGKRYLKKLFGLSILVFLVLFALVLVLAIPIIYLIVTQSYISAILVGLFAIAIFIPLLFIILVTKTLAEFYIVLSDLRIWGAVEAGYNLLLKNILNNIIFSLLLAVVSLFAGFCFLLVIGISLLVLIPSGILFHTLGSFAFAAFLVAAIPLFLALMLFVSSVFLTYKTTAWTLFFQEIASAKAEEAEKVAEEEPGKEIAAAPASPNASLDGPASPPTSVNRNRGESLGGPEKA